MSAPTFLAEHPAYLRFVHEVASGELVMPEYERDETNRVILHIGEQYCRYPGCTVSDHPYLTANLKKHVGRHSEDLQVADGVIGQISYIEQQKAQAWYNSLFASVPDPAPSSPSRSRFPIARPIAIPPEIPIAMLIQRSIIMFEEYRVDCLHCIDWRCGLKSRLRESGLMH